MSWGERTCIHYLLGYYKPCNPTLKTCNPKCEHYINKNTIYMNPPRNKNEDFTEDTCNCQVCNKPSEIYYNLYEELGNDFLICKSCLTDMITNIDRSILSTVKHLNEEKH